MAGAAALLVMRVTNLNDSGTGSLRWCLQANSERTCVFDTVGVIIPKSRLAITNPYVTVACQTAPGGGIVVGGPENSGEVFQVATHDVILSYCTWDGNNGSATGPSTGSVGLEGGNGTAYNEIVIANNTGYRWGNKGLFVISNDSGNASKFSFYRNFMFTPNAGHPVVSEPDTTTGSANATQNIDYIQNLIAFYDHRCILFNIGSTSMVNNVCYDGIQESSSFNTNFWNGLKARFEGNLYIDGPDSKNRVRNIIGQYPDTGNDPSDCYPHCDNANIVPQLYLKDNVGHPNDQTGATPIPVTHVVNDAGQISLTYQGWEGGQDPKQGITIAPMPTSWFSATDPTPKEQFPIVALADPLSFDTQVAPFAGNFQGLGCDGTWFPRRNTLDTQALQTYLARGSMPMYTSGPSPSIAQGTACAIDAKNNLPVAYETRFNIPAGTPSNIPLSDGYTQLEHYLWGISNGPTPPVVTCAPSSVAPGGNSSCSANQAISTWTASAGNISTNGLLTAPMIPSMVTVSGSNTNGSGQTPVTVATPGTWSGWLGSDVLPGAAIGKTVVVGTGAGPVRSAGCGSAPPISPQPSPVVGVSVTVVAGPASCNGGIAYWQVQSGSTPPPVHPTVSCAPQSLPVAGTSQCTANQPITSWSASAGTISTNGLFTAPAQAGNVTVTGTNANGSGTVPLTVTGSTPIVTYPKISLAIVSNGVTTTLNCVANQQTGAYSCTSQ